MLFENSFFLRVDFQGVCQGNLIDAKTASDSTTCLKYCKQDDNCNWYNFDIDNSVCILNSNCSQIYETEGNFVTGQKECPLEATKGRNSEY